jgi:AcrR family transcriptional regulator
MSPRRYTRHRRDAAMAETRRRIVAATVALHAERGAAKTSYADIAARADVAVPTVYKHFPTLDALFAACTGHASAEAPRIGLDELQAIPDSADRLDALARALFARHRYLSPWLRWSVHEAELIPELGALARHAREADLALIRAALQPACGREPPAATAGLAEALLDFRTWQTLTAAHGLNHDAATAAVIDALTRLIEEPPAAGAPARRAFPTVRQL